MSANQSMVLAVLKDAIDTDGSASAEVRQWVAGSLRGLFIAGPWVNTTGRHGSVTPDGSGNPLCRGWIRRHLGSPYSAAALSTGGGRPGCGPRTWGGWAAHTLEGTEGLRLSDWDPGDVGPVQPPIESLAEAMAVLDAALKRDGWTLMPAEEAVCPKCEGYGNGCTNCHGDGVDYGYDAFLAARNASAEAG